MKRLMLLVLTLAVFGAPQHASAGVEGSPWEPPGITATMPAVRVTTVTPPPGGTCGKLGHDGWCCPERYPVYRQAFLDAGWAQPDIDAVWPKVDYIMARESGCNPDAYNRSGASGLVQWMPFWFRGGSSYGWVFDPFDPYQALYHMALRVLSTGSWHDWCLRNDPVTGSC